MNYQDVLNKAGELYALMDTLSNEYLAQHREAQAIAVTGAKLHVQKILGVPPQLEQLAPKIETVSTLPAVAPVKRSHKRKA